MRHLILILISVSFFVGKTGGQNFRTVDSLNAVLQTKVGADRYSPLYELTFEYLDKDNEKALRLIEEAEKAALLSGDSLFIVKSKRVRGQILRMVERISESIPIFESALAISTRRHFQEERMPISNSLGLSYLSNGQFDRALEMLAGTLATARLEKDTSFIVLSLANLGMVYYKLHDYKEALEYFLECDAFSPAMDSLAWKIYVNISLCYSNLLDFASAEAYLRKGRSQCEGKCSDEAKMHFSLVSGHIFNNSEQYDKALAELQRSLVLAEKIKDSRIILDDLFMIAEILIRKNRLQMAGAYLKRAEQLIDKGAPYPQAIVEVYLRFSELYGKLNNYKKLAFYQAKYIHLKDSIYNYQLTTRLMATESKLHERENKAKIAAQQEVLLLKDDIIVRQRALNVATGLLGFTIFLFALFAFRSVRRKKELNILLEQKIRERTQELESSRDELLKSLREINLRAKRAAGLVKDSINRIDGLCSTALREGPDTATNFYLRRISTTADALGTGILTFFSESTLGSVRTNIGI